MLRKSCCLPAPNRSPLLIAAGLRRGKSSVQLCFQGFDSRPFSSYRLTSFTPLPSQRSLLINTLNFKPLRYTAPIRSMSNLAVNSKKHKVCVVGSGNWGTTIAKVVAENTREHRDIFEEEVQMWVFEEEVKVPEDSKHYEAGSKLCDGPQKLTQLINELHENIKYLPGITLPENIIANPDLIDAVKGATILIFNLPHQFIAKTCDELRGKVVPFARGISCIKGVEVSEEGCSLFSDSIGQKLGIYCGALSGANIANEVALEKFSETTVAYDPPRVDSRATTPAGSPHASSTNLARTTSVTSPTNGAKTRMNPLPADYPPLNHVNVRRLFHRPYFHVRMVSDVAGVSLGGALKNVVALAAGFVDGLGWGDNAKAAVMRVGILEEVKFGRAFFHDTVRTETFTEESCGVADLITSCSGGRNFRCAKMSVAERVSIHDIEERELNGQKLQGTSTAYEVNAFLKTKGMEADFPLFTAVYNILEGNVQPEDIPQLIDSSSSKEDDPEGHRAYGVARIRDTVAVGVKSIRKLGARAKL